MNFPKRLSTFVFVTAVLSGCGAAQNGSTVPDSIKPSSIAEKRDRSETSIQQRTGGSELLYATTANSILMLTYPDGSVVGKIRKHLGRWLCSDPTNGNVFVTSDSVIYEYAHGGTKPIATLSAPKSSYIFMGCAVDPTTGDLAAVNSENNPTTVAVYPNAQGTPMVYTDSNANYFTFCGYNNAGNLFIDGISKQGPPILAELPAGGTLHDITLDKAVGTGPVQWDGQQMTLEDPSPPVIYQINIEGSTATVVGTTKIRNQTKTRRVPYALTYIEGDTVIAAEGRGNKRLGYWNYPQGGKPVRVLGDLLQGKNGFGSITISP